jgi:hypothetical protein
MCWGAPPQLSKLAGVALVDLAQDEVLKYVKARVRAAHDSASTPRRTMKQSLAWTERPSVRFTCRARAHPRNSTKSRITHAPVGSGMK